jgi:hypothetical protein
MVRYFVIILVAVNLSCTAQRIPNPTLITSDHMRIDHVGQNDKPFPSLVITTVPLDLQIEEWQILVSDSIFLVVKSLLEKSKLLKNELGSVREYGVFRIMASMKHNQKNYFLINRTDSVLFLQDLKTKIRQMRGSELLLSRIDYLLSRIEVR